MGWHCHIPCRYHDDYMCPVGYVCDPSRCCDIPESGCVPDTCEPPLLRSLATEECTSTEGLGMDCTMIESCNPGQTCLSWEGITGETFWTCEIECLDTGPEEPRLCPNGLRCVDWDDGPQNICEPIPDPRGCDDPNALVCGHPERFTGALSRTTVCPDCRGVVLCIEDPYWYFLESLARADSGISAFVDEHGSTYPGLCDPGLTGLALAHRPDDCSCSLPSDYYWTVVCFITHLDQVHGVHCLPRG